MSDAVFMSLHAKVFPYSALRGSTVVQWLSVGLWSERSEFETYRHRVVSLSKTLYSQKVLVKKFPRKRWLGPGMTEKLLTGTLSLNTNKQTWH